MTIRVRFAPSPTGHLHVGNARMALVNRLYASSKGGTMVLRMDDTDTARSTPEFDEGIRADLAWLGIEWDELKRQSDRFAFYQAAFETLKAAGRMYPCFETPEELDFMRLRLRTQGKPPIYDRAALNLTDEAIAAFEAEGRKPHWRFKLVPGAIAWRDKVRGSVQFDAANLADPVLIRADGTFLYMLPSAVDDIEMGITHVVRGEDHVANTAVQIQLYEALGGAVPAFAHLPLLAGASGEGLSKRLGSLSLRDLRDQGYEPMTLNSLLARLGTSDNVEAAADLAQLTTSFDIHHFSRATAKFDPKDLDRVNAQLLHGMEQSQASTRLAAMGLDVGADMTAFWQAVRPNLTRFDEVREWFSVCFGVIKPEIEDAEFAAAAAELLPQEPFDDGTWKAWTSAVKEATGRKGKGLFLPLRKALTGRDHGPELRELLPLMGRARALKRLAGETA